MIEERALPTKRRPKGLIAACIGVVVLFVALGALSNVLEPEPQGPVSSSYSTNARGLAAWDELLQRSGYRVTQLRSTLGEARLAPNTTLVVLDPETLLHSEGQRLLAYVRAGGRLIIGGTEPLLTLPALLYAPPEWSATAPTTAQLEGAPEGFTPGLEVQSSGEGAWTTDQGARTILASAPGRALLLEQHVGRGTLDLLADASPLQNRLLGHADNAQLGLDLAGGRQRPVVFVESVHGYGPARGLSALPERWWIALTMLTLAGLTWVVARGRRLGPVEPQAPDRQLPRAAYVLAISSLLRRTRQPEQARALLRGEPRG